MEEQNSYITVSDLAEKYFRSERTIRNYLYRMADLYGFDVNLLKKKNEKGSDEFYFTEEQAALIGIVLEHIDDDIFLKAEKPLEKFSEQQVKEYRDLRIKQVEALEDEKLKAKIKGSKEYQFLMEMKEIHDEREEITDMNLFVLGQLPMEERIWHERRILEKEKLTAKRLMRTLLDHLMDEAYEFLVNESKVDYGDYEEFEIPSKDAVEAKAKELLEARMNNRRLIDFNYAGYNQFEKAIASLLKQTLQKAEG